MKNSVPLKILKPLITLSSGIGRQKKLFILIYHRVLDKPDFMRPGEADKAIFAWQMEVLASYFNVLPLHEALQKLQKNALPPRAVCITFDDGYADNCTNALPILKQFQLPATFFIADGFLDGGRMWNDTVIEAVRTINQPQLDLTPIELGRFDLSSDEKKSRAAGHIIRAIKHFEPVRRRECAEFLAAQTARLQNDLMMTTGQLQLLRQSGMEIGGHTVTHPILAKLDDAQVLEEISANKTALENLLNTELRYFAYPNGKPEQDYLVKHSELVRKAGYRAALSTRWGVAGQSSDNWQLPRFTPWDKSPGKFILRMVRMYSCVN
jgi:peptidoglycan/xylan/chitin deacetylase (PgdA/CDA1 family)